MFAGEVTFLAGCLLLIVSADYCPDRDLSQIEEGRRCRKPCSEPEDCQNSPNKTCQCDGACGLSCFNKMGECKKPDNLANGKVKWNHLRWGGTVRYSCNRPYALVGSDTRRCHADKKWGGRAPTCEMGCHAPDDTSHSYTTGGSNGFLLGETYSFSCSTGYYMIGSATRTCTTNGWTNASFVCLHVECGGLQSVPNGEIVMTKGLKFGSEASLQCNEGYRNTSPRQKLRCYSGERGSAFGEWEGELPSCEIISCNEPIPPEHGSIPYIRHIDPSYGNIIEYNCDDGFKIVGPRSGSCNKDGNWGEKPSCVEDFDCDFSDSICGYSNVKWTRVSLSGIVRDFVLQSGGSDSFFMSRWTPRNWNSICITFRYKLPRGMPTLNALTVEGSYADELHWQTLSGEETGVWQRAQTSVSLISDRSFQFHTSQKSVLLDDIVVVPGECNDLCRNVTCLNGGICNSRQSNFFCICKAGFHGTNCEIKITCNTPNHEENSLLMNLKPRWEFGDKARYICSDGYVNRDADSLEEIPTTITCQSNGTWSGLPPKCIKPFCVFTDNRETGPFPVFSKSRYNVNESVLLVCAKGYELNDKSLLNCQSMLTWERNPPTCRRISCGHLPRVAHSVESLTPVLLYGESFDFSGCTNGYYMDGPTRVTCRFDGSLSSLPTCKRVQNCLDTFPAIENGRKHVRDRVANFFCNPMHNLVGEHEIHCHDDGTWEHDAPYCREVKPSYRKVYDNVEYLIFMDPSLKSSYADAKRNCERLNGNVAIIYDERVRKKLEEVLTPIKKKTYKLYIGLKSRAGSEFEWDLTGLRTNLDRSSQTSAYRYWHLGTHDSPDDHECAVIERTRHWSVNFWSKRFGWTPIGCWEEHHFICQRDFNPCDSNPCANGGTCSSTHGRARCRCRNGYRGEHCTEEINCSVNDLASSIATQYRPQFVRVGSEITIQCKDGYRLLGSDKVLCGHGGRWNQHRKKCQEITCGELQVPEMVLIKNPLSSFPGSQAFFYCPKDYALEGYAGAVCSLDGKWSNITAVCRATKCEPPHLPDRSYIKGDIDEFPSGISVALGCLDGRRLVGSPTLRCENGQWSPTTSECIIPYCTIDMFLVGQGVEFNEMSLSEVLDRNFDVGERLTLRCQNRNNDVTHWSLEDVEPVVICQAGGRWSPRYDEFSCEE